jgi:hypothetical protein
MTTIVTLISLGLLAGFIYGLRRYQSRALSDAAERDHPLPPLPRDATEANKLPIKPFAIDPLDDEPPGTSSQAYTATEAAQTQTSSPEHAPAASQHLTSTSKTAKPAIKPDLHWRQKCAMLRDAGEHEAALAACAEGWPQWQSYQQGAIVIRAALRALDELDRQLDNTDWVAQTHREIWLERLFRLAAQASFLHDQVDGLPNLGWRALTDRFRRSEIENIPMPWHQLGYRQLRLLNQSDCRALVTCFGEPAAHLSAKSFHSALWAQH